MVQPIGLAAEPDGRRSLRYPDPEDAIAAAFVSAATRDPAAWERQDLQLLEQASSRTDGSVAVDFGTGTGRLLPSLASSWAEVVAYDPDPARLSRARRLCARLRLGNVRFAATPEEVRVHTGNRSAFILCSHVLQHVQVRRRAELVRTLSALAGDAGRILLLFSGRHGPTRYYVAGTSAPFPHQAIAVAPGRFDRWVLEGHAGLPVAHVAAREVVDLLTSSRRRVVVARPYRAFTFQLRTGASVRCVLGHDWCVEAE
jgi:Methyltransferase domain